MNFEEFQADSRVARGGLNGRVYLDGAYFIMSTADGWLTMLDDVEYRSNNLLVLEKRVYKHAVKQPEMRQLMRNLT